MSAGTRLPRILKWGALGVWTAYLGMGVWTLQALARRVVQPQSWPLIALGSLFVLATLLIVVGTLRGFWSRHQKRATLMLFCLGTIPHWLIVAHVGFIMGAVSHGWLGINLLTFSLLPAGCVVADLEANYRGFERYEGERVVIFHHGEIDAAKLAAEADRHIARLDALLERPARVKLRLVRGSLLGKTYVSFGCWALGTTNEEGILKNVDRHELAHAAINQHLLLNSRPPTVLIEGWAEACSGKSVDSMLLEASLTAAAAPTIAELTGSGWTNIDRGPVYTQGGPFVSGLLEHYGGPKFLELYLTCRASRFDADCRRVYGKGLDELEAEYLQERSAWTLARISREALLDTEVAETVDAEAWKQFVEEYTGAFDEFDRLSNLEITIDIIRMGQQAGKAPTTSKRHSRIWNLGRRHFSQTYDEVLVVTDKTAFRLMREVDGDAWQADPFRSPIPELQRWMLASEMHSSEIWQLREYDFHNLMHWPMAPPRLIRFSRNGEGDKETVTLEFEGNPASNGIHPAWFQITLSNAHHWRVIALQQSDERDGVPTKMTVKWDRPDEKSLRSVFHKASPPGPDSSDSWSIDITKTIRPAEPLDDELFDPAYYGVTELPQPAESLVAPAAVAAIVIAVFQLLLGLTLGLQRFRHIRAIGGQPGQNSNQRGHEDQHGDHDQLLP